MSPQYDGIHTLVRRKSSGGSLVDDLGDGSDLRSELSLGDDGDIDGADLDLQACDEVDKAGDVERSKVQ